MSAPLPPLAAIAHAVTLLEGRGFAVDAVNARGDAVYLRREPGGPCLRVANHARTAKQRARNRDIATSLVIHAPLTPERVAERVEASLRDYASAASGSGARK